MPRLACGHWSRPSDRAGRCFACEYAYRAAAVLAELSRPIASLPDTFAMRDFTGKVVGKFTVGRGKEPKRGRRRR